MLTQYDRGLLVGDEVHHRAKENIMSQQTQSQIDGKLKGKLIAVCTIGAVGGFLFGYDTSVINGAVTAIAG